MTTTNSKDVIEVLNDLIETSKDGEAGFKVCAEDVKRPDLKALFSDRAVECGKAASELQVIVFQLGGDPENSTSLAGEDVAKKSYKEALEKDLPADVRAVVERQYQGVLRNHDQIKALRDSERAKS